MNSRERVLAAIRHEETDRVPIDVGGTGVTSINLIAYGNLKRHLGLTRHRARIYHTWIQVPELEYDIARRLHVDTVTLPRHRTSLGLVNEQFKPWKFVDGTEYLVPEGFSPQRNEFGDYEWYEHGVKIAEAPGEGTHGFSLHHNPLREARTTKEIDEWFDTYEGNFLARIRVTDEELEWARNFAQTLRTLTDKAIVADYFATFLENAQGIVGWDTIYMHMLTEPKLAHHFFERLTHELVTGIERYLGAVGDYVDVFMVADDVGHQRGPMMKPEIYRQFVLPGHKAVFEAIHNNSDAAVFFHTDGSVMPLLPDLIDAGMDCFNSVQTDADDMDAMELKRRFGDVITFWGGGVDTHRVLPFATPDQVREDVRRRMKIFAPGGGYVFATIHNILGDVPPENILAAFDAAREYGIYPISAGPEDREELARKLSEINYWQKPMEALKEKPME
ncbi:MAG TPA: uroporphyrinogen decarboxylase family protein [Candidatus Sulfomarinibacteraceae bacterium]|nr:uroporphyrinogen decarboxylase family protein [Candidatus Sulfomarinibacteraceae bacterium]